MGLYVGGTGSDNKLDDFERGTFSPKLRTIGSSQGELTGDGRYTKIGDTVHLSVSLRIKMEQDCKIIITYISLIYLLPVIYEFA